MEGRLIVNREKRQLVMSKAFEKYARLVGSDEYNALVEAMNSFPTYSVVSKKNRRNSSKNSYNGLTYAKMEDYILTHPDCDHNMMLYQELRERGELNKTKAYPIIKKWFLDTYPEIRDFGKDYFKNTNDESSLTETLVQGDNKVA